MVEWFMIVEVKYGQCNNVKKKTTEMVGDGTPRCSILHVGAIFIKLNLIIFLAEYLSLLIDPGTLVPGKGYIFFINVKVLLFKLLSTRLNFCQPCQV